MLPSGFLKNLPCFSMPCFPDSGWELWAGRALYIPMSYITVALPLILMKNTMNQVSLTGRNHILRNTNMIQRKFK